MKYFVAFLAVLFSACGGAFSAVAQVVPNRDSAAYYFKQGNFYKYEVEDNWAEDTSDAVSLSHLSKIEARKQAIACYTKSIAFDSSYYWSYHNRGSCYQFAGAYASALADYNRAVLCKNKQGEELGAYDASVRFDCIDMCFRLALWSEAEAHCSVILVDPRSCADTTCTYCYTTDREWPERRPDCHYIWLRRADARAKQGQYAPARRDYLIYQRQILRELAVEEDFLVKSQVPLALYRVRKVKVPPSKNLAQRQASPLTLTIREPLPKRLQAEVLARHHKSLVWQRTRVNKVRAESEAVAAKITELDKLLH